MSFSEWLKNRLVESLNPELEGLKRQEQQLLMSMEMRKDPMGRITVVNRAGYIDAENKLKEVRARIKELESRGDPDQEIKPIPAWIRGRRAV
jgi:hypothetical protein